MRLGEGTRKVGTGSSGGRTYELYEPENVPQKPPEMAQQQSGMSDYYKENPNAEVKPTPLVRERMKFEQFLIERNKVPIGVSRGQISEEVNRRSKANEEATFMKVFGGQFRYEDRNEMGPQENAIWKRALLSDRKQTESRIVTDIEQQLAKHKDMMQKWDDTMGKVKEPTDPTSVKEYEYGLVKPEFRAYQKEMIKASATTVNLGTATKTELEKSVVETQSQIDAFNEMETMFKDEYLTIPGRIRAKTEVWADKLGVPVSEKWLGERQQWYQIAKERFLAYRKWVTGVAGGEKEMAEIAKSYPDPDKNSPVQYKSNLKQARINALRLQKRFKMFLDNGITPTKAQLSSIPLEQIKLSPQEMDRSGGTDQYEVGATYEDAAGNKKTYRGKGEWDG